MFQYFVVKLLTVYFNTSLCCQKSSSVIVSSSIKCTENCFLHISATFISQRAWLFNNVTHISQCQPKSDSASLLLHITHIIHTRLSLSSLAKKQKWHQNDCCRWWAACGALPSSTYHVNSLFGWRGSREEVQTVLSSTWAITCKHFILLKYCLPMHLYSSYSSVQ